MNIRIYYYFLMVALIVLIATVGVVYAYELSPVECEGGAKITHLAAYQRDQGVPKAELIRQTAQAYDTYSRLELYKITLNIIETVYAQPSVPGEQLAKEFLSECVSSKGAMYQQV